jgi:PelA/Pel-15E family pectate lyase
MKDALPSQTWRSIGAAALALLVLVTIADRSHAQDGNRGRGESRGVRWGEILSQPADWYADVDAVRIADNVLLYQHSNGGWPKNIDMARRLGDAAKEALEKNRDRAETIIDNGATHTQIRYLARVHNAAGEGRFAEGCLRGIEFVLVAQYPNGGWPMIFPLRRGYYSHITFNDGAMIGVMNLLRDVAAGETPFEFVDASTRGRAAKAVAQGLEAILKCQIVVDGKLTAWCAQHDEHDFSPAQARSYELPSIGGQESVGIVRYLMALDSPSPEVKRAIEGAVAWFDAVKIEGQRVEWKGDADGPRGADRIVVADPGAEPLWARFYEMGTNRPMFVGRDGVIHDRLADIEQERRVGYAYLGPWADDLLERDYPRWKAKWGE